MLKLVYFFQQKISKTDQPKSEYNFSVNVLSVPRL